MIMGHSGHSYMALEYAKAYPERVSHVVMIGCPPKLGESNRLAVSQNWNESVDPERKKAMEAWNAQISDDELAQLSPEEAFIRSYVRNGALAWYDPYYDSTPLWEGIDINIHMFNHVWGKLFAEIDITKGLKNLNIPVLLVLGRYDYLVAPSSSWDPFRSFFKDLTIRIFEKSGHTPQFEESALFNRELLSWIQSRQK
jgi:proline iminopeptidase